MTARDSQSELMFKHVLGVYNALWDLGGKLVMAPTVGDHDNWLLNYRDGLRGMLARILAVDRHLVLLHRHQREAEKVEANPKPGYVRYFPRVTGLWKKNEELLSTIFEYHDVTKHRSSVVQGGGSGQLRIRDNPKQPGSLMSSISHALQSLAHEYQEFLDELLPIALEEGAAAFGYTIVKRDLVSPPNRMSEDFRR